MEAQRRKVLVAGLSVASNSVLVVGKLAIGLLIGSVSVISEAIHSGVDLVAALIAFVAVRTSGKPADEGHPYGHGKIENISGAVEALLIFVAAAWIVYEAVHKLSHPQAIEAPAWGIAVMATSSVVNLLVSRALFRVGRETDSIALQADAWHLRTDVYTSAGVMAGLAVIWAGAWLLPGKDLAWIDPVAAIAVALLIVRAAWELTVQAVRDLLDAGLPSAELVRIRSTATEVLGPAVRGIHHLRSRRSGPTRFVDFHLKLERDLPLERAHAHAMDLSRAIERQVPGSSITVHIEPCDGACRPVCVEGCFLPEEARPRPRDAGATGEPAASPPRAERSPSPR